MEVPELGVELELQLLGGLRHSHSKEVSEPYLQPKSQLMATLDPYPLSKARHLTHVLMGTSHVH